MSFLLVVTWLPVDALYTLTADCQDCFQEFCNSTVGCYNIEGPTSATCNCSTFLVKCMSSQTPQLTPLASPSCMSRSLNISLSDGTEISMLGSGFFMFRNPRLCTSGCFNTMRIHTVNFQRSQESDTTLLKIHIFKRYSTQASFPDALFVEQYSSNATLSLVDESPDIVQATLPDICYDSGDFLGFTIGQALQIRSVTGNVLGLDVLDGALMYNSLPVVSNCNSSSTIVMLPGFGMHNQLPVMAVFYKGMCIKKF